MRFFDAHAHIHFPQFDEDRADVLLRMQEKHMDAVLIGTDLSTSTKGVEMAESHENLWAAVGLHPNDNVDEKFNQEAFLKLAQNSKVVAIGECGLDYFRSGGTPEEKEAQKTRFLEQVRLAEEVQKALIIHCRNAHEDMLALLAEHKPSVPVVMHFFTGSGELAQQYLDLGCYLSFPGPITYTDMYDDSIRIAPMDKILAETDAPFAAPVPYRGKRNEPSYVEKVVEKLASIKEVSIEEMATQTVKNAQKVFGIARP